jgi:hypothetical protein
MPAQAGTKGRHAVLLWQASLGRHGVRHLLLLWEWAKRQTTRCNSQTTKCNSRPTEVPHNKKQ